MKEATGDLNMTLIIAMIVGLLASFFYFWIWPKIGESQNTDCAKAVCEKDTLNDNPDLPGYVKCKSRNTKYDGSYTEKEIWCKYKG